jgi:hypothetical protein|tara:strand:- start:250 stop:666 length:417 start_codon:yes stop_codon:yes gene_type:complete
MNGISSNKFVRLSEGITIKRIPVLQHPEGPELSNIKKIRENEFLSDFRKIIVEHEKSIEIEEVKDIVTKIEKEFTNYRNEILISKQRGTKILTSVGKNAASFVLGKLVPGSTEIISVLEDYEAKAMNWTAFISSIEKE